MSKRCLSALALAGLCASVTLRAQNFASAILEYQPGAGFAAAFTDPAAALGEPSRHTPGLFGGPVDPFNPPWQPGQLVSIGAGGWLTVEFASPVQNHPENLFGLDFLIFGNAGFMITNALDPEFNFLGTPATDGSLFGDNLAGRTRVSVSADNLTYYTLNPALAPAVDGLYPTDGAGDFTRPVNPHWQSADFAGLTLTGIRGLYDGSAGGAGFDLAWALDAGGQSVPLESIRFARVEVLEGKVEIDGFAAVPEPGAGALLGLGLLLGGVAIWRRRGARA